MANEEQLGILKKGIPIWNEWRRMNQQIKIDLQEADLRKLDLSNANLEDTDLSKANLTGTTLTSVYLDRANLSQAALQEAFLLNVSLVYANLEQANLRKSKITSCSFSSATLRGADLNGAGIAASNFIMAKLSHASLARTILLDTRFINCDMSGVDLTGAQTDRTYFWKSDLSQANLQEANLEGADFASANLTGADLRKANLARASLIGATIQNTNISESYIYGINVWDLKGEFKEQNDLVIANHPRITVDNIKIAQFIYLILNNEEIRHVINTVTSKSVLILGRFALPERKAILDALRNKIREYDLIPIVFDFDRPTDQDFTETIKTLAGLSYFAIVDVTNPKSSPLELQATVPDYQIPFVPIIQEGESPFAMMVDLQKKYNWVLNTVSYDSQETLMKVLEPLIIGPAMKKRQELRLIKAQVPEVISGKDFLAKGKE